MYSALSLTHVEGFDALEMHFLLFLCRLKVDEFKSEHFFKKKQTTGLLIEMK